MDTSRWPRLGGLLLLAVLAGGAGRPRAAAAEILAFAVVQSRTVHAGESFLFQVQVRVSDGLQPAAPDLSGLKGVRVTPLGPSTQTTIFNGQVSRTVIFSYRLVVARPGTCTIPALVVKAGKVSVRTRPVSVQVLPVKAATGNEDGKIVLELSKQRCYVGEPIVLTVSWYLFKGANGFEFNLPLLDDERFLARVSQPAITAADQRRYLSFSCGRHTVHARQREATFAGRRCLRVRFRVTLVPLEAGNLRLPQASVFCNVIVGYQRSRDPFFDDPFFGRDSLLDRFFSRGRKPVTRKAAIGSNQPVLEVSPLPAAGRPSDFSGLVGKYSIIAKAEPRNVSVGDPITLTVQVAGPGMMERVELPPLESMPGFAGRFKVPRERGAPKIDGPVKTWTQTVRALSPRVKEIPAIRLPYFDVDKGAYMVARSEPIPLRVKAGRVVTAADAEGAAAGARPAPNRLETFKQGIAYNYEGAGVLDDQEYGPARLLGSPAWLALLLVPPGFYLLLLVGAFVRARRDADPAALAARRAWGRLKRELAAAGGGTGTPAMVLQALRRYLGARCRRPSASLTFAEVEGDLERAGVPAAALAQLRQVMAECEAAQYGGDAGGNPETLVRRALEAARMVNRSMG